MTRHLRPIRIKKGTAKEVQQFWEEQAKVHKESQLATNPDTHFRDLEIRSILAQLPDKAITVLDVGCGNGYSTFYFARERRQARFVGVDYSEKMVAYAEKARTKHPKNIASRVEFGMANVLNLSRDLEGRRFDYIISERCLINLADWKEQRHALLQMRGLLKKNGRLLLTENTQEGLARLNKLRAQFSLKPITVRWHNYYMPEGKLLPFLRKEFVMERVENFANLYYIISRVVYAKLAELDDMEPDYNHPINEIAAALPSLGNYHFSPNFIFTLKRK